MSDYEHIFSEQQTPAETQLRAGILATGLQPELLAGLPVEDAKFMLRSVLKALGTLTHPDHGADRSAFGLDIQDINSTGATIAHADDALFTDVLSGMTRDSALMAEMSENTELTRTSEATYNQATALGLSLISKERPATRVTGSIAVTKMPENLGVDKEIPLNQELLVLQLGDGVVHEALVIPTRNVLASKLSDEAQSLVHSLRPDLDANEHLVYIDAATAKKTDLPESWCRLVTAKGKTSGKKVAGVKIYELADATAYSETQLVGTRAFGRYVATTQDASVDPFIKQLQSRSIRTPDITKLSGRELAKLLANNQITLPHSPEELIGPGQQPLVLVKEADHGTNSIGYLVQNPAKLHLSR